MARRAVTRGGSGTGGGAHPAKVGSGAETTMAATSAPDDGSCDSTSAGSTGAAGARRGRSARFAPARGLVAVRDPPLCFRRLPPTLVATVAPVYRALVIFHRRLLPSSSYTPADIVAPVPGGASIFPRDRHPSRSAPALPWRGSGQRPGTPRSMARPGATRG